MLVDANTVTPSVSEGPGRVGGAPPLHPGPSLTLGVTRFNEVAMRTINIHEAKKQLSKLVDQAAQGDSFVIARAGKPLVKVAALDAPAELQRLGFLKGEIDVSDDFDRMGEDEIAATFGVDS